jgi:hypothetical protein
MLPNRTFNVVLVNSNNGIGMQMPVKFDKVIHYTGKTIVSNITSK